MATSSRRSSGPVLGFQNQQHNRSSSPSGRFCSSSSNPSASSSGFASSSSSFSSRSTGFFHRSTSPSRVNMCGTTRSSSPSVRFSIVDRSISPSRSISASPRDNQIVKKHNNPLSSTPQKRTCMCSPTNHPGSFRCSLHKNTSFSNSHYSSNRLNARRSAMTNSLVRIWSVEGDLVKRALAALIRPSSHHQRRRAAFEPRPSRLSSMSKEIESL